MLVLGFAEMLKEDRPAEDIWMDDRALIAHFQERERARGSGDDDDDDWGPEGSMISNRLADDLMKRVGAK